MRKLLPMLGLFLILTLVSSYSLGADGDYTLLFNDTTVHRIDIVISAADYRTMENNLATLTMMSTEDPVYVPVTVKFNNNSWMHVGMRYKGQSTLFTPKMSNKHKYPFRLKFNKYKDEYPETQDQEFYGFKEMIFSNNWYDSSFIRDKVCADIFRDGGIPTPRAAFCRVYIDTGSGPVYWGLYTMFEDPSDEMLKSQFANAKGNLYKGQQATGADLRTFSQQSYEKKTNEDANDWSDLRALVTALNASRSNAAAWRAGLEAVFDVNKFLRWLAINTAIVNPDTYGWVTKNHYLYQDLANNGRMVYLPWDFNLSLSASNTIGIPVPSLSLSEITSNWPLIRYLLDDPVYKNTYLQEMRTAMSGCFNEAAITAKMRQFHELIRPYVVGAEKENSGYTYLTNGATEFDNELNKLISHVGSRQTAVRNFLGTTTPVPTPTVTGIVTPTPPVGNSYSIAYEIQNDWGGGATVNVTVKNNSAAPVNGWKLVWKFSGNQQITNLWNGTVTQSGTEVTVTNANYNGSIGANGGSVSFGFNLSYSGSNAKPSAFTLNGVACQVQ
jgi:spore coat protein H